MATRERAARKNASASRTNKQRKREVRRAKSELYRTLVVDAAERLFAERGIDETRMEAVAAAAGLSLGTIYSVFDGKADVVAAVHAVRLAEVLDEAVVAARDLDTSLDRLLSGVRTYVGFFLRHPDYLRMHLREGYTWATEKSAMATHVQVEAWHEGMAMQAELFRRGIAEGTFYDGEPELMTRMMIAMQQVQLAAWVEGGMKADAAAVVAEVEQQVRRSFVR